MGHPTGSRHIAAGGHARAQRRGAAAPGRAVRVPPCRPRYADEVAAVATRTTADEAPAAPARRELQARQLRHLPEAAPARPHRSTTLPVDPPRAPTREGRLCAAARAMPKRIVRHLFRAARRAGAALDVLSMQPRATLGLLVALGDADAHRHRHMPALSLRCLLPSLRLRALLDGAAPCGSSARIGTIVRRPPRTLTRSPGSPFTPGGRPALPLGGLRWACPTHMGLPDHAVNSTFAFSTLRSD
mmetsp:Transcript_1115/g.3415  ORF Transcript_1115/g.3415 Transcript_1115/m.3415 type:complete len:244 (-) Transcript_1115:1168-1899(-)